MKKPISFGSIGIELVSSMDEARARPTQDTPFRICILGDFTGLASRRVVEPLKNRRLVPVDRDIIDTVMEKMKVSLRLESAGTALTIPFASLDDFHPDHLLNRIGVFRVLKDVRKKLGDPRTFTAAVHVLQELTGIEGSHKGPGKEPDRPVPRGGSILDEMIGQAATGTDEPAEGQDLDAFLKAIVRPHLVAGEDPEQARLTAALDKSLSDIMAEVMHHKSFQALESAWRGIQFLVSRIETDESLQIFLLDISAEELSEDLFSDDDLSCTGIYRLLAQSPRDSAGTMPLTLLAGIYSFDHGDAALLGRMAKIASAAHAPFIAQADPCLVGCPTLDGSPDPATWRTFPDKESLATWDDLRHLPETAYLGLVMPRFLLRLPFGRDTDAAETFAFEEMEAGPIHEHYLWGNPALACAYLLARSFSLYGWEMHQDLVKDVDNLPLHVYSEHSSSALKPCAEVLLSERAVDTILDAGIMPLATLKDTDTARLVRFQSLKEPPTGLAGRWSF
jgi:type VI secretion system protein ImpC